jgi:UPF0755 protein
VSNNSGGWRPDEQHDPLPPEYEPVHHEPRRPTQRHAGPWRHQAQPQQPVQQPVQQGPYQPEPPYQPQPQYQQDQYQQDQYQQQPYQSQQRFVPGFSETPEPDGEWIEPQDNDGDYRKRAPERDDQERPPKRRRRLRWLAPWLAVLVILTPIAYGGFYAYGLYQNKYHPADYSGSGTGTVKVQVTSGDTASTLAPELVSLGVVASSRAFVLAAEHSTSNDGLEPGFFLLHQHMQASLAYAALIEAKNMVQLKVDFPEGLRLTQILAKLVANDPRITMSDYQKALTSSALGLPSYARGKPEGYLFPDTYEIQPNATALSVLQQMTQAFSNEAAAVSLTSAAKSVRLTPAQVIVVASLVQAEGGRLSDYPKIARVIYNRLAQGMKLEFDSTVFYGLGTYGIAASDQQLTSNSPYNTYKYAGLPPGPIDSPGAAAIKAALQPAAGDWVYFVTVNPKTGETLFTDSEAQFEQYEAELRQNEG